MNEIDDERVRFFLKHRAFIKQWSQIEKDVPAICEKFLWSLQDEIEELATTLGDNVRLYKEESTSSPKLFLYRESWLLAPQEASPPIGIGVEWWLNKVDFERALPFVGIWKSESSCLTEVLREELAKATADVVLDKKSSKPSAWFLERTFIAPPNEAYWEDLGPYRKLILDTIQDYWSRYALSVDTAIQSAELGFNQPA